jgi:hypothetical protein
MGSKNLKAIAVQGTGSVSVSDNDAHLALVDWCIKVRNTRRTSPWYKGLGYTPGGSRAGALYQEVTTGQADVYGTACQGCFRVCDTTYKFKNDPFLSGSGQCVEQDIYVGPEALYRGGKPGGRTAWLATQIANAQGINAYEFRFYHSSGEMLVPPFPFPTDCDGGGAWMWECANQGLFNEANTGLPWDKLGSKDFIEKLLYGVAHRTGDFCKLIGDGMARAALSIRDNYEDWKLTRHQGYMVYDIYKKHYPRAGKFGGYPAHHTRCG